MRSERARSIAEAFRLGIDGLPCAEPGPASSSGTVVVGASAWALKDERVEETVSLVGILGGVLADLGFSMCPIGSAEARRRGPDLVIWICGDETESDEQALLAEIKSPGISIGSCAAELPGWTDLDPDELGGSHELMSSFATQVGYLTASRDPRGIGLLRGPIADRPSGERGKLSPMPGKRGRSAITGKYVKQSTVKKNPRTTVNESTKKSSGRGRKKK